MGPLRKKQAMDKDQARRADCSVTLTHALSLPVICVHMRLAVRQESIIFSVFILPTFSIAIVPTGRQLVKACLSILQDMSHLQQVVRMRKLSLS